MASAYGPDEPVTVRYPHSGYEENLNRDRGDHLQYFHGFIEKELPDGRLLVAVYGYDDARNQYALRWPDAQYCPIEQDQSHLWHVRVRPDEVVERG